MTGKKYLHQIPTEYKRMSSELVDYIFYYTFHVWCKRYGYEATVALIKAFCVIFACDQGIIMNLISWMRMYPEKYRHDIRHAGFVMYAMDVPSKTISWTLHTTSVIINTWVKTLLQELPSIKRLYSDEETEELKRFLSCLGDFKGAYV